MAHHTDCMDEPLSMSGTTALSHIIGTTAALGGNMPCAVTPIESPSSGRAQKDRARVCRACQALTAPRQIEWWKERAERFSAEVSESKKALEVLRVRYEIVGRHAENQRRSSRGTRRRPSTSTRGSETDVRTSSDSPAECALGGAEAVHLRLLALAGAKGAPRALGSPKARPDGTGQRIDAIEGQLKELGELARRQPVPDSVAFARAKVAC